MNTAPRSGCGRCQEPAAPYQLWCTRCGNPLPADSWHSAPSSTQKQGPLRQSIDLYWRVLDDAKRLSQQPDISNSDLATVQRLYSGLLAREQHRLRQQQLEDARDHCLNRVRLLIQPHVNQLKSALEIAQQTRRRFPDDAVLADLVHQLTAEQVRRRQHLAQSRPQSSVAENKAVAAKQPADELVAAEIVPDQPLVSSPPVIPVEAAPAAITALSTNVSGERSPGPVSQTVPVERVPVERVPVERRPVEPEPVELEPVELEPVELGPSTWERIVETTSEWSSLLKPFLLDNVGWFVGAFLIIAGFVVLIVAFRQDIGENPILMWSIVFWTLMSTTGAFFALAYLIRRRYPQLETTSNVLLTIVALLIPLVFAAAALTTMAV